MENEIKRLLEEEIKTEIQVLSSMEPGSKEKSAAIEDLTKIYRLKIEESKNELNLIEFDKNAKSHDADERFKKEQFEEQVKDKYFRLGIAAAEIVLPLIFYAVWMRKGFKFEENGTYTSTTFRGLFSRFKPTKK